VGSGAALEATYGSAANAADLPIAREVEAEVKAIVDHRRRSTIPIRCQPGEQADGSVRKALNEAHALAPRTQKGMDGLETHTTWKSQPDQRYEILPSTASARYPQCVGTTRRSWPRFRKRRYELRAICDALTTVLTRAYIGGEVLEPKAQPVSLPSGHRGRGGLNLAR